MSYIRLLVLALLIGRSVAAQSSENAPASKCWRLSISTSTPALDWEGAGHQGKASDLANRVQRVRDSVFAKDTNAIRNNSMYWEQRNNRWSVVLFPTWWPVGVKVEFDSVRADGVEMTGSATALVADAGKPASTARARAVRCPKP